MRGLRALRESGNTLQEAQTRLLHETSIQNSMRQWLQLQSAFEWQLQQSAPLFEQERRAALVELQARLRRLGERPTP